MIYTKSYIECTKVLYMLFVYLSSYVDKNLYSFTVFEQISVEQVFLNSLITDW